MLHLWKSPRTLTGPMVLLGLPGILAVGLFLAGCGGEDPGPSGPTDESSGPHAREQSVPRELEGTPHADVAAGDLAAVLEFLSEGGKIGSRDRQQATLLHVAAIHGRKDMVKLLLERGADLNARGFAEMTALHQAAFKTHWIPPGAQHGLRVYPACGSEHLEVAQMLIDGGADISARDNSLCTPLHLAAKGGNLEVVKLLVELGADVEATDDIGKTPLHHAAQGGNHEPGLPGFTLRGEHTAVARHLLQCGADPDAPSITGTPLTVATRSGASDVAEVLLEAGADPTSRRTWQGWGRQALHEAAFKGDTALLTAFLEKGADLEAEDQAGRTPLFHAALSGHAPAVQLLLERGAKLGKTDKDGDTLLHAAVFSGNVETLRLLLDRGGNVHSRNGVGDTLLHAAARDSLAGEPMLVFLLEKGLDINAENKDGHTPLRLAEDGDRRLPGTPRIEDALRRRGATR